MLIYNIFLRYFILLAFLLVVFSCNKIEVLDQIVFDYNQLPKIVLSAEKKKITETYKEKLSDQLMKNRKGVV